MAEHSQSSHRFYHTLQRPDPRVTSLTAKNFAWLLPEAWSAAHLDFYIAAKNGQTSQMDRLPAYVRRSRHPCPQLVGHWVLTDSDRQPLALAEAQMNPGAMATLHLVLSALRPDTDVAKALSFLISACFLNQRADVVKMTTSCPVWRQQLEGLGLGSLRSLLVPTLQFGLGGLLTNDTLTMSQLVVGPQEWWEHPLGQRERVTLNYLSLRQQKAAAEDARCNRRPTLRRRGFWDRLFGGGGRRPKKKT